MNTLISRRTMLKTSLGLAVSASSLLSGSKQAFAAEVSALPKALTGAVASNASNASNEKYWQKVASLYKISPDFINLENGLYGVLPKPILAEYQHKIAQLNERSSLYIRQDYAGDADKIRAQIAAVAGVLPEEIALTRGGTESLQILITNYNKLKPGDTVLYSDVDYDAAQTNIDYLKEIRGVNVGKITIPEPASYQAIIDTYIQAFANYPQTKLLLLTHISHRTGLVIPVAEIAQIAKQKGIDVLVDAAHSFGHLDFKIPDLNADFAAFTLHKWIGAPLGVGFIYIRKARLGDIHPHLVSETPEPLTPPISLPYPQRLLFINRLVRLIKLQDYVICANIGYLKPKRLKVSKFLPPMIHVYMGLSPRFV